MLHLSLIKLPRALSAWRFLRPYELHQVLWRGFASLPRGDRENRFLYRHEERDDAHSVLVQSVVGPDWGFLADEASGTTAECRTYDPRAIEVGSRFEFFVRANPVVDRRYPDGSKRRIAVGSDRARLAELRGVSLATLPSRDDLLIEWLERSAAAGGFALERGADARRLCDVGPNRDLVVRKNGSGSAAGSPVTLTTIDFGGILRVTDSTAFSGTLRRGIGRGRAFGCGLVSVRRA